MGVQCIEKMSYYKIVTLYTFIHVPYSWFFSRYRISQILIDLSAQKGKSSTKYIPFEKAIRIKSQTIENQTFTEFKYLEKTNYLRCVGVVCLISSNRCFLHSKIFIVSDNTGTKVTCKILSSHNKAIRHTYNNLVWPYGRQL